MIEVKNITKKYKKSVVIDNLSLTFDDNSIYGLLGPDGAGKTTVLNAITGYTSINDGCVIINGVDIHKNHTRAKRYIGYLPENLPLYNNMTVYEYLLFVAELKRVDKKSRADEIERVIELTNIDNVCERVISTLSKEDKQRVGIAQALIGDPEILIFDEPANNIDLKNYSEIKKIIRNLGENHIVVISGHSLSELSDVCDRIYYISKGKFVAGDTTENLKKLLGDKEEILITVVNKPDKAVGIIRKIEGISKVEKIGKDKEGHHQFKAVCEFSGDIKESVSNALANNKITVVEIVQNEIDLEKLLLNINSEENNEE